MISLKELGSDKENYGIWFSKRGDFRTLRTCRHHGLEEFRFSLHRGRPNWECLECKRQRGRGIHTSKIAGSSNTVGLIIAEMVLSKAFKVMVKAHPMDAFDFYCGQNLKIDSKCSTLVKNGGKIGRGWRFEIRKNKVPDAFCLIALDNLPGVKPEDAKPIHVWLIRGDDIINGRPFNDTMGLSITPRTLARFEPWRRMDMEGRVIKCCANLKSALSPQQ